MNKPTRKKKKPTNKVEVSNVETPANAEIETPVNAEVETPSEEKIPDAQAADIAAETPTKKVEEKVEPTAEVQEEKKVETKVETKVEEKPKAKAKAKTLTDLKDLAAKGDIKVTTSAQEAHKKEVSKSLAEAKFHYYYNEQYEGVISDLTFNRQNVLTGGTVVFRSLINASKGIVLDFQYTNKGYTEPEIGDIVSFVPKNASIRMSGKRNANQSRTRNFATEVTFLGKLEGVSKYFDGLNLSTPSAQVMKPSQMIGIITVGIADLKVKQSAQDIEKILGDANVDIIGKASNGKGFIVDLTRRDAAIEEAMKLEGVN